MEWQPIETAPKGELIALYFPPITVGRSAWVGQMFRVDTYPVLITRKPTHWLPLPEPPTNPEE